MYAVELKENPLKNRSLVLILGNKAWDALWRTVAQPSSSHIVVFIKKLPFILSWWVYLTMSCHWNDREMLRLTSAQQLSKKDRWQLRNDRHCPPGFIPISRQELCHQYQPLGWLWEEGLIERFYISLRICKS